MPSITSISALEILDSRGNPTLQVSVTLDDGTVGTAAVPSGASTGTHEALELRDGDAARYGGKGVQKAVANVEGPLAQAIVGMSVASLPAIDQKIRETDGTENKSNLGANACLGVSLAVAHAAAGVAKQPLYTFLAAQYGYPTTQFRFPTPMCNVINGGVHADSGLSFQEFMLIPAPGDFPEQLRKAAEVFHSLAKVLHGKNLPTLVGDEGGYAPRVSSNSEPFQLLTDAITQAGQTLGKDVFLGMDAAASEFQQPDGTYRLALEGQNLSADQLTALYQEWNAKHHLVSVEDGLGEDDWEHWPGHTATLGKAEMMVVGDDLFVTNVTRLQRGITEKVANAILIKVNQIGTLSETIDAIRMAQKAGYKVIISHRSGETPDTTIADLSVAVGADYLKAGSLSRGERLAKYNRLLEIWHDLHA